MPVKYIAVTAEMFRILINFRDFAKAISNESPHQALCLLIWQFIGLSRELRKIQLTRYIFMDIKPIFMSC